MKAGRIKDPLYKDYYLGLSHLPSSHLLRPPTAALQNPDPSLAACGNLRDPRLEDPESRIL